MNRLINSGFSVLNFPFDCAEYQQFSYTWKGALTLESDDTELCRTYTYPYGVSI